MFKKIVEDIKKHNGDTTLILGWCCYTGIGATMHWKLNWNQLKNDGIFETLTRERGCFAMDEYVLDLIGMPYQGKDTKMFNEHIFGRADVIFKAFSELEEKETDEKKRRICYTSVVR